MLGDGHQYQPEHTCDEAGDDITGIVDPQIDPRETNRKHQQGSTQPDEHFHRLAAHVADEEIGHRAEKGCGYRGVAARETEPTLHNAGTLKQGAWSPNEECDGAEKERAGNKRDKDEGCMLIA